MRAKKKFGFKDRPNFTKKKTFIMEIMKKFACKTHRGPRNRGPHMN